MSFTAADAQFMARALELARRGLYTTDPNPRVGSVVVNDGKIVGEGFHARAGEAHAERNALAKAGAQARGATVYVTLEPCCHHGRTPPCVDALLEAGVARVVAAMQDPNPKVAGKGFAALEAKGVATAVGLLQSQAEDLNPGFISRMQRGRPFVRIKLALSLDGRTALADGESRWISGEPARVDVQTWRARSSAILTGVDTVLTDDPRLTVRDFDIGRSPLRVVVDSRLRMPASAQMLRQSGAVLVVTTVDDAKQTSALNAAGAEVLRLPAQEKKVNLSALLERLAEREVSEVLVEAGATLCGALLRERLADELVLYYAPCVLGNSARGVFDLPPLARMNERMNFDILDTRVFGKDWRLIARPKH
jgi:diaminohydroxyphosphoribosylaminopyrimidine deaminase/5-amino-6-(5-phosphoribosylamino)uracil reductase